jgi:energy-coupling factor transport system permease protein
MATNKTTATLFIDKDSWIQGLHPLTKLSYILLTGVAVYGGPPSLLYSCILLLFNAVIITSGGLLKDTAKALLRVMLPLLLFMIPIHSFLYPSNRTILLEVYGMIIYQEGLIFAISTLTKLTVVLLASFIFVFSTHPADLITALSHTCRSPSLAYLLGSPLLLLASMRERIETIQAAQRARGLDIDGNMFKRFLSLAPLLLPLVLGAIVEVEQRSIALEVRGFKSTSIKTSLRELSDSALQRFGRWFMLALAASVLLVHLLR